MFFFWKNAEHTLHAIVSILHNIELQFAVRSRAAVLLVLTFCLLLLPSWQSVIVLCFVIRYVMSILVLHLS